MATSKRYLIGVARRVWWFGDSVTCAALEMAGKMWLIDHCMKTRSRASVLSLVQNSWWKRIAP